MQLIPSRGHIFVELTRIRESARPQKCEFIEQYVFTAWKVQDLVKTNIYGYKTVENLVRIEQSVFNNCISYKVLFYKLLSDFACT